MNPYFPTAIVRKGHAQTVFPSWAAMGMSAWIASWFVFSIHAVHRVLSCYAVFGGGYHHKYDASEHLFHVSLRLLRNLARVISERKVKLGIRRTLWAQAQRLERLAKMRLEALNGEE